MAADPVQETYRRVLVVEDDEAQRWTLTEILREEGLDVTACASATEALERLARDDIRVVILDLRLPDLTGVQLLNRLGDRADDTSIIINTGHSSYQSAKDALNLGAFAYVEKAGAPEELLRHVHRAVAFQLRRRAEQLEAAVAESADELKAANRALRQEVAERKEAEAAVRESETRFRELAELLPQTILEIDAEGRITFVNRFAHDSFGPEPCVLVGRDIGDLFAPEDRARLRRNIDKRLAGTPFGDHEYLALRDDGATFPVLLYSSAIVRNGKPVGLRCIAVDIADRRAAEMALQESKAKLESIFESSPHAITVTDLDLRLEDCNPAMLRIFALPGKDRILGTTSFDFVAREDHAIVDSLEAQLLQDGLVKDVELTLVRPDGTEFPGEVSASLMRQASGEPMGIVIITSDITDRKQAETALRESERKLSTLMANLPGMAYRCLADEAWTMQFVSEGCTALTGYDSDDLIENRTISYDRIIYPGDRRRVHAETAKALADGGVFEIEYRIVTADGQEKWVWERGRSVNGHHGQTGVLEGFILDISERKKAEQALRFTQFAVDRASDSAFWIGSDGRFVYVNDAACKSLGFSRDELLNMTTHDIDPDFPPSVWPDHWQTLKQAGALVFESHHRDRHGCVFPVELTANFVVFEGHEYNCAFARNITERKETEASLLAYQNKLKSMASELALTEERERRRIAADLHDHACQSLALSKMRLQDLVEHSDPANTQALQSICETLNTTIESVRELTFDLSSPTLYKFGLEAALEELLEDKLRGEHHILYRFRDDKQPKPLPQDVLVLLFQSVRELLFNVIKHSHAHEVALDIRRDRDSIRITVADDGTGFDVADTLSSPSRGRSVGLFNLRERLDYIGGTLDIDSAPGRGSRFVLVAPLKSQSHATKESHDGGTDSAG
ncbi:MAG: PAS domain S-box protein [Sedimentisphaerales bacterium]|jgi:PAS domain S-box-containing protein|nr:PAS domain S-box protein [Sedimentisphaerales bacterium]NLT78454.1 PAS domain S-box protein [Planctomycetota bacterium]